MTTELERTGTKGVRVVWAGVILALPVIAFVNLVLIDYFGSYGGESCDVYCGPGNLFTIYGMAAVGFLIWVVGMIVGFIELVRARAKAWWAWAAIAVGVFCPLYLTLHLHLLGMHR